MYKFTGILLSIFISLLVIDSLYFSNSNQFPKEDDTIISSEALDFNNSEALQLTPLIHPKQKTVQVKNKTKQTHHKKRDKKATLAIIMDDIATLKEAKEIKKLHLNIIPSIFPKTSNHPKTPKIAKMFKSVMIHLPMEAKNWKKPEKITLKISDDLQTIKEKLKKDLKGFSNVKAINNHTGSKFTTYKKGFKVVIKELKKRGIFFIDSKTTTKSKYIEIQRELGEKIFQRDIFLDNIQEISYIKNQIKKAIRLAKKKGFAIAICHPHTNTFKALNQSKKLLKTIRLVNIDEISN